MKESKALLLQAARAAQLGQTEIRSLLDAPNCPRLRQALEAQLRELGRIEGELHALAGQRGWEIRDLDPAVRFLTDRKTRLRLDRGDRDSCIAALRIRQDTDALIRGTQRLRRYPSQDAIRIAAQKLLDCETDSIRKMKGFL